MFSERFRQADGLENRGPGDLHGAACVLRCGLRILPRNDFSDGNPQVAAKNSILLDVQLKRAFHPEKCFLIALSVREWPTNRVQDEEAFNVGGHAREALFGHGDRGVELSLGLTEDGQATAGGRSIEQVEAGFRCRLFDLLQ